MTPHPQSDILRAIADGETDFQVEPRASKYTPSPWLDACPNLAMRAICLGRAVRIKPKPPKTININGFEVPEPIRVAPIVGQPYWLVRLTYEPQILNWIDTGRDRDWLELGIIHDSKAAAQINTDALLSFFREDKS